MHAENEEEKKKKKKKSLKAEPPNIPIKPYIKKRIWGENGYRKEIEIDIPKEAKN